MVKRKQKRKKDVLSLMSKNKIEKEKKKISKNGFFGRPDRS